MLTAKHSVNSYLEQREQIDYCMHVLNDWEGTCCSKRPHRSESKIEQQKYINEFLGGTLVQHRLHRLLEIKEGMSLKKKTGKKGFKPNCTFACLERHKFTSA